MTFDEWFQSKQGEAYESMYAFAKAAWKAATLAEREECAKLCESRYMGDNNREDMEARRCATAIRARSNEGGR